MNHYTYKNLNSGRVYRRDMLLSYSKSIDRDLDKLVEKGFLRKLSGGLYYKPLVSNLGILPPEDNDLIKLFLRDDKFLLYSWNQFNSLGLGLTQLYNRVIVLNQKRHGVFKLGNKEFDFRRSSKGFPKKITPEFLLVELLNNCKQLAEDISSLEKNIKHNRKRFDKKRVLQLAKAYGKISTIKFLKEIFY